MTINISDSLKTALASIEDVIIYVAALSPLDCSLKTLQHCKALKVILFSETEESSLNANTSAAFDFAIPYRGPKLSSVVVGNPNLQSENSPARVIHPIIHSVCTEFLETCLPIAKNPNRIFLMTNSETYGYQVALIREQFGLKLGMPPAWVRLFIEKSKMKAEYRKLGIPTSPSVDVNLNEGQLTQAQNYIKEAITTGKLQYPVFAKPASGAGSIETGLIKNDMELDTFLEKHQDSPFASFIFEELLYLPVYAVEVAVTKHHEIRLLSVEKVETGFSTIVTDCKPATIIIMDSDENEEYDEAANFGIEAFRKLNVSKFPGVYFIEMMRGQRGELVAIEMAARNPLGVFHSLNVEIITGFDTESFVIAWPFLEDRGTKAGAATGDQKCAGTIIYPCISGILLKNQYPDSSLLIGSSKIHEIEHYFNPGDHMSDSQTINQLSCEIAVSASNQKELEQTFHNLRTKFSPILLK